MIEKMITLKTLIESAEKLHITEEMSEESKSKIAKWVITLLDSAYEKGLKDGKE